MAVIKRNGNKVDFDGNKIKIAIKKANSHSESKMLRPADIDDIADYIEFKYRKNNEEDITIEEIQDMVEEQIMSKGAYEVARTYVRYRYSRMGKHDIEDIDKEANHKALSKLKIRKKSGTVEKYNSDKIIEAVNKSAARAREDAHLTEEEEITLITLIESDLVKKIDDKFIPTNTLHLLIEKYLDKVAPDVGKAYTNYHSFRMGQAESWEHIMGQCTTLIGNGTDNETMTQKNQNANADSQLSSTQKCFFADYTAEQYYEKFFLTKEERQIAKDGYLYWHDKNGRIIYSHNCCLWKMDYVLEHGFMMNGIWYNTPKTLDVAFDVLGDLTLMAASQQYGGFTIPRIDSVLVPYAEKSYKMYKDKYMKAGLSEAKSEEMALDDITNEMYAGFQGLEYKFNTVASSRGDYPFTTVTFGLDTTRFGKMASKICLKVRQNGQGKKGKKKPVLFPKLVFLYDENLHGEGCVNHDVFEAGLECSSHTMYPDWLSLTGEGYIPSMYKKYGEDGVISPMGCEHGQEIITYKLNGNLYIESFERFWKRMSSFCNVLPQPCDKGDGKYLYIDLSSIDVQIYDTKEGFVKVKKLIRNFSDNWNTVKMSNGRNWLCTTDHPFETINRGEVLAKDLNIGDKVWINSSSYSEETKVVEDDYAWLLGFMLCDGCYQNYSIFSSIALHGEDKIEQKFKETFPKYFGLDVKTVIQHRGKKGDYKDLRVVGDGTKKLSMVIDKLTELFGGVQKKYRHIPNEVFSWNYSAKMAFLAGVIDADGYIVDGNTCGKSKDNTVEIGSTNKELAIGQMYLAQALGMPARIYMNHYNRKKPDKIRYQVNFCGISELANYIVCDKKKNKIYEIESLGDNNTEASITEIIPEYMEDYSYDVETESGHFECSGVYSHNCRAFLSPYYERGGFEPADDDDKVVYEGRFNLGVISLNLPMMLAQSREEDRDFYEVLDYYLNIVRENHKRTYNFIGHMKASKNPVGFCYGGFYGGHLNPEDEIAPVLKSSTMSFGITALNELQRLYNGKSLVEDNEFALEVMKHINDKIAEFKAEDHILYAIYGTPAENLCNKQVRQFRAKYGIIPNVSDREYVSNSFHCHVTENITPIEKQDREEAFWNLFNGGKIQYCRYPVNYNIEAMKTLILRAMKKGFYEGVNLSLCFCDDCGYSAIEMGKKCPECGGYHITQIDRMNGYLAFTRVGSDTRVEEDEDGNKTLIIHSRYSPHKIKEISERISM